MKEMKRKALRIILGAEIALVTFYYLFGSYGLQALRAGDRQNRGLLEELKQLEGEITALSGELEERKNNPFYKESIARKELQMAYDNEIIYLLPKKG